jgi:hypothetical protein
VQTLLEVFDDPAAFAPFLALIRAAVANEHAATLLREFLTREVLGRLAVAASPDRPELRASLAGSQVVGLAIRPLRRRRPPAGHHRSRNSGGPRQADDPALPDGRASRERLSRRRRRRYAGPANRPNAGASSLVRDRNGE